MTAFVLTAGEAAGADTVGGKAAMLARLQPHFPVPPFLVITAEAFTASQGLSPDAAQALYTRLDQLGPGPFAVRSSGRDEDGATTAHAGQFLSLLQIAAAEVAQAAERVWRSGFDDNVTAYRSLHGLGDAPHPPAVIVQAMVPAVAAGVAFSADPLTGDRQTVVISATHGLADRLVSGEVDGDQYWIGETGDGRCRLSAANPVLNEPQQHDVAELARRVARYLGGVPQDIEWAYAPDGTLYVLQSRPITTLGAEPAEAGPLTIWDNANIVESYPGVVSPLTFSFARYVYAHVYQAFSRLMGVSAQRVADHRDVFAHLLGRLDGRMYYNLLNWYRALALFPGFASNREYMEGMMGTERLADELVAHIVPPRPSGLAALADRLRLARVAAGLLWHQLVLQRTVAAFNARLAAAIALTDEEIARLDASGLAAAWRSLERQLLQRWDAPLINDFLCMFAFGASRRWLHGAAGEAGLALHADTLIGRGDIVSAEPARLIRQMGQAVAGEPDTVAALARGDTQLLHSHPALAPRVAAYLARFADRCTQELKLESLTLHDDLRPLAFAVAASARGPQAHASSAPSDDNRRTLADTFPGKPLQRWLAARLLAWASARVRDRENLRFERTRLFGRVRRLFLALGRRLTEAGLLADERQVFCLTVDEVLGAVEGTAVTENLRALAHLRQQELDASLQRPDPPQRLTLRTAFPGAALRTAGTADTADTATDQHGSAGLATTDAAPAPRDDDVRQGLACCQGVVTARVRVITDPRVEGLQPGEILVARHTDPGWIAVFAAAVGVIAERGSLLSHSAIVARELGLPCVVAVGGVTAWLRTGDTVTLDGSAGTITRVRSDDMPCACTQSDRP